MSIFLVYWQLSQARMANFPAFIGTKSFDLRNHHIPQMKWQIAAHFDAFLCKPDWVVIKSSHGPSVFRDDKTRLKKHFRQLKSYELATHRTITHNPNFLRLLMQDLSQVYANCDYIKFLFYWKKKPGFIQFQHPISTFLFVNDAERFPDRRELINPKQFFCRYLHR